MVCTTIPKEPSPPPPFEGDQRFACGCGRAVWDMQPRSCGMAGLYGWPVWAEPGVEQHMDWVVDQ